MKTCVARKVFKMSTDAPDDESFIKLADTLARQHPSTPDGLISWDMGDAMGALIQHMESNINPEDGYPFDEALIAGDGFTVTLSSHWELFEWGEGDDAVKNLPAGPFDHLTRQDIIDAVKDEEPDFGDEDPEEYL